MVIAHGATSGLTGILVAALGHYMPIIRTGVGLWAVAACVKTVFYDQTSLVWMIFVIGIFEGFGVGCCLQPGMPPRPKPVSLANINLYLVLVGLLAGSHNSDRAVITGLRNFIRDIGGAVGITVSGTILNNILQKGLKDKFSPELISQLTSSAFALGDLDLSAEDKALISNVYMGGMHAIFGSYAVLMIVWFGLTLLIEDYGLGRKEVCARATAEDESG